MTDIKLDTDFDLFKMSFLESIKLTQASLKSTETLVTQSDGKVYKETKSGLECIGSKLGFVIDNKPDIVPAKIVDFLYLGSQDCCEENVIKNYDFKYILSIGVDTPMKYSNVTYKFVECLDLPDYNLETSFTQCIPFIKLAISHCSNILVHCNAGVSRSPTLVIAFLMLVKRFSFLEAYDHVKKARNCINPNVGFIKQLQNL